MASFDEIQLVSNEEGVTTAVIVPIDLWREIESERETAYLLKSKAMATRLIEAKARIGGMSLEDVLEKHSLRP
jgi:antitoxin YefM